MFENLRAENCVEHAGQKWQNQESPTTWGRDGGTLIQTDIGRNASPEQTPIGLLAASNVEQPSEAITDGLGYVGTGDPGDQSVFGKPHGFWS